MTTGLRVFVWFLVAVAPLAAGASSAQASTTVPFASQASLAFGSSCPVGVFACGTGSVAGFGKSLVITTAVSITPAPPCLSVTSDSTITLDGGTLAVRVSTLRCSPGEANLLLSKGSFTITGGTGDFAGASGGGEAVNSIPTPSVQPVIRSQLHGWLTLP